MKKYKPQYLANTEWTKDIKFNNHWYHLRSVFDNDQNEFDFNQSINDRAFKFDFNQNLLNNQVNKATFDFNIFD